MKNLSILKPYLHTTLLNNEVKEKVTYLNIPTAVDVSTLKADVKLGAKQFAELDRLIEKENEPKYILIFANNLEQGYMAVTYLSAGFNQKHGLGQDLEWDARIEEEQKSMECWDDDPLRLPVIKECDLKNSMGDGNDPFAIDDMFMQGNQKRKNHNPYWMDCVNNEVCIVSEEHGFGWGFSPSGEDQLLFEGLKFFSGNDKVYVIVHNDESQDWELGDYEEEYEEDNMRAKWNGIVLSFAADEVAVKMMKDTEKEYYKLLFRGVFEQKNITPKRGFSYERLANMIASMQDPNKCELVEKVVNYAIKDWKCAEDRMITNKDFAFMDRFCRAEACRTKGRKGAKRAMDRLKNELIGMEEVKKQVCNLINVMKYNKIRAKMNIGSGGYHNVHVMLGAPGTAKTTVAQIMGQLMVEEKLLPDNRFICVNGAELKGMYVGHSAPKTKALFENNDIIVIDEAYSLVGDHGENDSFSKEALAQLIIELENHSMDKLVIFAGYGGKDVNAKNNKMKDFLDANPGIKSRITSTIYFPSYSAKEMGNIFMSIAKNQKYHVDERARALVEEHFKDRIEDENFGNGREARSLLETSVLYAANRIMKQNKKTYTKAEMQNILYEDVEAAVRQVEQAERIQNVGDERRKIGF